MERQEVIATLESLANGMDPAAPEVNQALVRAVELLKRTASQPASAGARWTSDEDEAVARAYDSGTPIAEIAAQHNRTRGAITSRLVKLGKIDPSTVRVRDRSALAATA